MKYALMTILLTVGLALSPTVFSQDETAADVSTADNTDESKDRNRGDNKNRGDRNNGDRNNNDLSGRALRVIDTDEDGQVSIDEYMAHAQQRFTDLDLDGNNFVTSEEAKEAAEIMRERQNEARSSLNKRRNQDSESDSEVDSDSE